MEKFIQMLFHDFKIRKRIWFILMLCLLIVVTGVLIARESNRNLLNQNSCVEGFLVASRDGYIEATWDSCTAENFEKFYLVVEDDEKNILVEKKYNSNETSFIYENGEHGKAYVIRLYMLLEGDIKTNEVRARRLFLNYGKLPEVPFLNIQTVDGEKPSFEWIQAPEGALGLGITENEYKSADMMLTDGEERRTFENIRVKVRGNTINTKDKQSYKIKLSVPQNLFDYEDKDLANSEWILLEADDLKHLVGTEVGLLCGMKWQPRYKYVNLMINGDYIGGYWLSESVDVAKNRCDIESSGYLIEMDAYWWNSEGNYFMTDDQEKLFGFTFKYPDEEQLTEEKIAYIRNYMNDFQKCLYSVDPKYQEYIDVESFARWTLAHNILGTQDSSGSNKFYYKDNFDPSNPKESKLCAGPVWDFGSIYRMHNDWAQVCYIPETYIGQLWLFPEFREMHTELWGKVSATLAETIDDKIQNFIEDNGAAMDETFVLESARWNKAPRLVERYAQKTHIWMERRTEWLNKH